MSKKKAFGGNTMTLKDFHGGSIPSDLPLPSAPGAVNRSTDWSNQDRPSSWGGSAAGGRPDYRTRPNSSPATRHFDDKTPFLTHTARIGRNFDEDERKPLDGNFAPRRTISDESFCFQPTRIERKPEPVLMGIGSGLGPGMQVVGGSYSGVVSEGGRGGISMQTVGGSFPNAWTARKELAMRANEMEQSVPVGMSVVSKMAHASALDKVSSGRWQTKHSVHHQVDVEVIDHSESGKVVGSRFYDDYIGNGHDVVRGKECIDVTLQRHMERGLTIDDRSQGVDHDRVRAPLYSDINERKPSTNEDRGQVQPSHTEIKFSGSVMQQPPVQSEAAERPKIKLLPRTKLLENFEPSNALHKQVYHQPGNFAHGHRENITEVQENGGSAKPGCADIEGENQVVERPKLNLKPRSQPLEQSEGNSKRERSALFGGARPREQVLKDRGIDDAAISTNDVGQHPDRIKHNFPKTEKVPEHAVFSRNSDKSENPPLEQRIGKKFERKDLQNDAGRVDTNTRNWHRNSKDTERQQQRQQVNRERPPAPETWRKPVEQPKPASPEAVATRYSKAASALELAHAFSRSVSDPTATDRYPSQRGLPSKTQVPFSRLVASSTRPQINGY